MCVCVRISLAFLLFPRNRWGLVPSFTKQGEKPNFFRMFNARSETVGVFRDQLVVGEGAGGCVCVCVEADVCYRVHVAKQVC